MKGFREASLKKALRIFGTLALFFGTIAVIPTSMIHTHEPKCPDDLLK